MSEEPLSSDSASETPKKPRRVSTPRPRKTAKKAAAEKPVESAPISETPAPAEEKAPRQPQRKAVPRDPRLDDISGHEGPPSPPPQRQGRVTSNVRDARSEESRAEDAAPSRPERSERPAPARQEREIREEDDSASRARWPEPETIQGGDNPPSSGKRKRRRKKKGGQGGQGGQSSGYPASESSPSGGRPNQPAPMGEGSSETTRPAPAPAQHGPRVALDADEVSKKAWRIFLGEVGEEGLALIGDSDARELSRRSFRLAEIFLEEQGRRGR